MSDIAFGPLLEQSALGLATFSVGGRFLSANPAFCRLLGYTEAELREKTHLDVIHPEDLKRPPSAACRRSRARPSRVSWSVATCIGTARPSGCR